MCKQSGVNGSHVSGTHVVRDLEREVGLERAVVDVVLCSHANGKQIYVSKLDWEWYPFSRPTKLVLPSAFSREAKAAVIFSRSVSSAAEASSACSWAFIGLQRDSKERKRVRTRKDCTRPGSWGQKVWENSPLALEDQLRAGVAPGSELGGLKGDRSLGKVANWTRHERPC